MNSEVKRTTMETEVSTLAIIDLKFLLLVKYFRIIECKELPGEFEFAC